MRILKPWLMVPILSIAAVAGGVGLIAAISPNIDTSGAPRYERTIAQTKEFGALSEPTGIAVNKKGDLFVVDSAHSRVTVFDKNGKPKIKFPGKKAKARLGYPLYIALSPKKEVFVSDREAQKILVFTEKGQFLREFNPKEIDKWTPVALAFDEGGYLYISDFTTQEIRVFGPSGRLVRSIGTSGEGPGSFQFVNGIVVDKNRIYVSDGNNGRVQVFSKSGKFLSKFLVGSLPRGIALDQDSRLFVIDNLEHQVKVFQAPGGRFLFPFGAMGKTRGQILFPSSIALDGKSRIYVSDKDNNRVLLWSYR